jgi:hypothetical protein
MNNTKILQIIPAPADTHAVHEFEGQACEVPIVALALVEEQGLGRYVVAMEMQHEGTIVIAENEPGFMFILPTGDHLERKEGLGE